MQRREARQRTRTRGGKLETTTRRVNNNEQTTIN
jgi:hypothetical protein